MIERFPSPTLARRCWHPAADLYRITDGWLVKLELAGVALTDVQVHVTDRRLYVAGVRRDLITEVGVSCQSLEISYDSFERSIEFPVDLTAAEISSEMQHGMLLVRIRLPAG
ncbi:MAG: Hsp20/alpha crystallin family protein [Planctomycetaceae bacterium]